jgi:hypothetical protein
MLWEQGKGHHEVVFFHFFCGSLDQAARYIAEGVIGVLEQLDCGFGNVECGLWNPN